MKWGVFALFLGAGMPLLFSKPGIAAIPSMLDYPQLTHVLDQIDAKGRNDFVPVGLVINERFRIKGLRCQRISARRALHQVHSFVQEGIRRFDISERQVPKWRTELKNLIGRERYFSCSNEIIQLVRLDKQYRLALFLKKNPRNL